MIKKKPSKKESIFLGIDYGESNIGLAFGRGGLASPIKIISGKDTDTAVEEIVRVILENNVSKIVMGLPLTVDEKETPQSLEARKFAKVLKIKLKKPILFVNEYETSVDAGKSMLSLGFSRKRSKKHDHFSAALILRKYFEANS